VSTNAGGIGVSILILHKNSIKVTQFDLRGVVSKQYKRHLEKCQKNAKAKRFLRIDKNISCKFIGS